MLALSACSTLSGPSAEQLAASDDSQCVSYGFKPGTDAYGNCRLQLDQGRQERRTAVAAAILSHPYVPPPVYQVPMPVHTAPPRPVTCNSTGFGNMVTTNCY